MKKKFKIENISQPELSDEQLQILSANIKTNGIITLNSRFKNAIEPCGA